jgi:hypothetical protein
MPIRSKNRIFITSCKRNANFRFIYYIGILRPWNRRVGCQSTLPYVAISKAIYDGYRKSKEYIINTIQYNIIILPYVDDLCEVAKPRKSKLLSYSI